MSNKKFTWDQDWPLSWLVWNERKGIIAYMKEEKRFYRRFQKKPTRENIIEVIESVVGSLALQNKNMNTVQNFASHYNGVVDRSRTKESSCNCAPLEKTAEIIKVYAIHPETRIDGLAEHIQNVSFPDGGPGFFKPLFDAVKKEYDADLSHIREMVNTNDLIEEFYLNIRNQIVGLKDEIRTRNEQLEHILKIEKEKLEKLKVMEVTEVDEILNYFKTLPDEKLRSSVYDFFKELKENLH